MNDCELFLGLNPLETAAGVLSPQVYKALESYVCALPGYKGHAFDIGIKGRRCFVRFFRTDQANDAKDRLLRTFAGMYVTLGTPPKWQRDMDDAAPIPDDYEVPSLAERTLGSVAIFKVTKHKPKKPTVKQPPICVSSDDDAEDFDALLRECLALLDLPIDA
jgi:hypothetical protein